MLSASLVLLGYFSPCAMFLSSKHALSDKNPACPSLADHTGLIAPGAQQRCCRWTKSRKPAHSPRMCEPSVMQHSRQLRTGGVQVCGATTIQIFPLPGLATVRLGFMSGYQYPKCMCKCCFSYNFGSTLLNHCPVELKFYFPALSPGIIF